MKKTYSTPKLNVHGSIEELTQSFKKMGTKDGMFLAIDGDTNNSVSIGPLGS